MKHHLTSNLAAALFLAITMAHHAAGQPLDQICGVVNYTANGTYQSNIQRLAATLPKNISSSQTLFAKAQLGAVPDIVYALALCRGDTYASACGDCVATAFQDAQRLCAYSMDATVFYNFCLLRFSNLNFLDSINGGGNQLFILMPARNVTTSGNKYVAVTSVLDNGENVFLLVNTRNATAPSDVFDDAVAKLLNATANYAADSSSKRFGTAVDGFQTSVNIYGLAQCTPDMTPDDCRTCLSGIIQDAPKYFSGKQGARAVSLRCNYRYEVYPFFNGTPLLQLPKPTMVAPAPAPVTVTQPDSGGGRTRNKMKTVLEIALPVAALMHAITIFYLCFLRRRLTREHAPSYSTKPEDLQGIGSLLLDLSIIRAATDNFAESNWVGEGGFGTVYKGVLPDGQEIAVKRFSQSSGQGIQELKNELVLIAKLQHKNLVRLVGVCLQEHEKLLVYEYMPNRSIDTIIFDPEKSKELDWGRRFNIINGIARGLNYLHEDSQLKIIHRDLKASNVLLAYDYTPKISDFGLARLFGGDQSREATNSVVGTYGYMAPEYAMRGHYSIKSDVFSFGVLILEILTGRRSSGSYSFDESVDLISLVWEHWTTGTITEIIDSSMRGNAPGDQMLKCIHIGLLCVQDNPMDRPVMSKVNVMLSSGTVSLQAPLKPEFFIPKSGTYSTIFPESYSRASESTSNQK